MDSGFEEGRSDNLPSVDSFVMMRYLSENPDFISSETRSVKAARSARQGYGDNAVGFVQVKRENEICIVKAIITPEHKVRGKYNVVFQCREYDGTVDFVKCEGCAASLGGCKHAIAFLTWLHRRSEEPASTSVKCYWKRSQLAGAGTTIKYIKAADMGKGNISPIALDNNYFLKEVLEKGKLSGSVSQLTKYFTAPRDIDKLSLHYLVGDFICNNVGSTADEFLQFCKKSMKMAVCCELQEKTVGQSGNPLWMVMRYGRITASTAHKAAKCKTPAGVLVETILGGIKLKNKGAIKRGREFEPLVIAQLREKTGIKMQKCGLYLSPEYPIFGASPDAVGLDLVVEVKCPAYERTEGNYLDKNNVPQPKYMAQIQLQMHLPGKKKGLFCVASHDFEKTKRIKQVFVEYDAYCTNLIKKCHKFWCVAVYPLVQNSYK